MKQAMFTQQEQKVKADPRIKIFWWLLILYCLCAAFAWFMAIVKILTIAPERVSFFNTWGLPLLWTALALLYVFVVHMWQRFDQKRQAAAQGDPSLLAEDQPLPNVQALSLPLTIRMRTNRKWVVIIFVSAVFAFLIPSFVGLLFGSLVGSASISLLVLLISLGIGLLIALLFVGLMLSIMYVKGREQITLTEHGILLVGMTPKMRSIPWSEAKLFAIINPYKQPRRFKNRQSLMFELANEHEMIRWIWLPPTSLSRSFMQPVLPPEEYEQQMQGVLSVISAKTGLPLYDLRKSKMSQNR